PKTPAGRRRDGACTGRGGGGCAGRGGQARGLVLLALLVLAALGLAALVLLPGGALVLLALLRLLLLAAAGRLDTDVAVRFLPVLAFQADDALDRLGAEVGRGLQQAVLAARQGEDELAHRQIGDLAEGGADAALEGVDAAVED